MSQVQEKVAKVPISGPDNSSKADKQVRMEPKPSPVRLLEAQKEAHKVYETIELGAEEKMALDTGVSDIILESIAKGNGTKVSEFADDMALVELGGF